IILNPALLNNGIVTQVPRLLPQDILHSQLALSPCDQNLLLNISGKPGLFMAVRMLSNDCKESPRASGMA
ncbi:hypothetical protein ACFL1X_14795, partial [Candidatus Hydrogenedentota bacterium]